MTEYSNPSGSTFVSMIEPGPINSRTQDFKDSIDCLVQSFSNSATYRHMARRLPRTIADQARKAVDSGGGVFVSRRTPNGPIESAGFYMQSDFAPTRDHLPWIGSYPTCERLGHAAGIVKSMADHSEAQGHTLVITVSPAGDDPEEEDYQECLAEHESRLKFYHSFGRFAHTPAHRTADGTDQFESAASGTGNSCSCSPGWLVRRR